MDHESTKDKETIGLKSIIVDYLHQWKLFLAVFIISFIPAILYLVLVPRTFEVMTRIQIQDDKNLGGSSFGLGEASGLMKSFGLGGGGNSSFNMDDEIHILSSNDLLKQVIVSLDLNVHYMKPNAFSYKMYKQSPFVLHVDSALSYNLTDEVKLNVSTSNNGRVKVKVEENGQSFTNEYNELPATIKISQGEFILNYSENKDALKATSMDINVYPANWIAEDMAKEILVDEVTKSANILEISCLEYEKSRGVDILNTLVSKYNEQAKSVKDGEIVKSISFIDERIDKVTADLHQTEVEIEKYKRLNSMTDIEYDVQFYVAQMQELQVKIIELESEVQVISLMDTYVKDPANKYNLIPVLLTSKEGEGAGPIATYNKKLMERSTLLKTSKEESPLITKLTEQADKLRGNVFTTISNAQTSLQQSINELKKKEKHLYAKMGEIPKLERDFIEYKRQQEIFQGVYLILLQKREELSLSLQTKERARTVDTAFVKKRSVGPRKLYAALGIILMTLVIPVLWIMGKGLFDELKKEYIRTR